MKDVTLPSKTVFMVRRKSDGLFSTGGCWPSFTKKGKQWPSLGALKLHLGQLDPQRAYTADHEVIGVCIAPVVVQRLDPVRLQKNLRDAKLERDRKAQIANKRSRIAALKKELAELGA